MSRLLILVIILVIGVISFNFIAVIFWLISDETYKEVFLDSSGAVLFIISLILWVIASVCFLEDVEK